MYCPLPSWSWVMLTTRAIGMSKPRTRLAMRFRVIPPAWKQWPRQSPKKDLETMGLSAKYLEVLKEFPSVCNTIAFSPLLVLWEG